MSIECHGEEFSKKKVKKFEKLEAPPNQQFFLISLRTKIYLFDIPSSKYQINISKI